MIPTSSESILKNTPSENVLNNILPGFQNSFATCYAACEKGEIEKVKICISQNSSLLTEADSQGQTLFFACAANNQLQVLEWLFESNPLGLKSCRSDGRNLMHIAIEQSHHVAVVQWLHRKDSSLMTQCDQNKLTPLALAAFNEQIVVLKLFIKELKADPSLIHQIAQKNCPKSLALLLEQGVDPNIANPSGQTLLHLAAEAGQENNILCLLQYGAKVNAQDHSKRTPISLAIIQGHEQIVKLLIKNKADLKLVNEEKETVLHIAASYGHKKILSNLLSNPICKKLVNAQDKDGKTVLHKSVWGEPKPAIVNLLIEHEANVQAINLYGYTALHWAAKHGHIESAKILLRSSTEAEVMIGRVNDNQHLPFDLAIRFEQDDFIRAFLGTKEKLESAKCSSDFEGFYSKCLLQARRENLVGEQILYLLKLSALYLEKAENEKDKEKKDKFILVGAKILNCAMILVDKDNSIFQSYLFKKLEEIEKLFLTSQGAKVVIKKNAIKNVRERLKEIRNTAEASHEKGQPIQETLHCMTQGFKQIIADLIADTMELLGPSPVKWAAIGMGSMSRGEMCPYSDIEFAFLIEKESEKALNYFRTLSRILELKVINLGETKFPVFGGGFDSPTPDGFCMDSAGNTPLGVKGVYELIGTPKQLAQFQSVKWMERNIILPNAMSNICLIAGNAKLEKKYNQEKKNVQQLTEKKEGRIRKNDEELAMRLLGGHLIEFSPDLSQEKEKETAFGVKKELYRPFQEILGCFSLLYDLKEKSTFGRIDELMQLNVFSLEGAENLKKAINRVLSLRLQVHLFYKDEKEFLCHPQQGKQQEPNIYYFTEQNLEYLFDVYKVLLPFHKAATEFYRIQSKEVLSKSIFYDDNLSVQGEAYEKTLQYDKAQEAFQQAVSLNPNDEVALSNLGGIEDQMGKRKEALSRYLKALEIAREKYGENHPEVAMGYSNIGSVYNTYSLGEHNKALEFHQKALKIRLQMFDENHPDMASSYNNIGGAYQRLEKYGTALEFHQKALKIRLQVLDENHPDVALSYSKIGLAYESLGDYDKALEFLQKALKIELQVLGENHPDVALSYNNIGHVYRNLKENDKALEFHQEALKIWLQVFGEDHPKIALSYHNIGVVYRHLKENDKALEFYQKALKIELQVLGENHRDVGISYKNIGNVYKGLREYDKALEFYQKALKIELQVLGENHPDVALSYKNIGSVYYSLRKYDKALEFRQKALKIRLQVLGENHPDVALSYKNIGNVYYSLREYDKVLECRQKALKIELQVLGENHPDVALSYRNIGLAYHKLGIYDKALEFDEKALEIQIPAFGKDHLEVATTYCNMGHVYKRTESSEKAIDYFKMSFEIMCASHKKSHPDILSLLQDGLFVVARKLSAFQRKNLVETYPLCEQTLGAEHKLTKEFYSLVHNEYDRVLERFQKDLQFQLQWSGENSRDVAIIYKNIADVYARIGDYEKALNYYQKALPILLEMEWKLVRLGLRDSNIATIYNNIGNVYHSLGAYDKALEFYQEGLQFQPRVFDENNSGLATSYNNIGNVYKSIGDYEKALNYFRMTVELWCGIDNRNRACPMILTALRRLIFVVEKLQPLQCQSLKQTHALCVEALGTEHELTQKLSQLIKF